MSETRNDQRHLQALAIPVPWIGKLRFVMKCLEPPESRFQTDCGKREDRSPAEGKELVGGAEHPNVIQIYRMGRVPPEKEWFAIEMEYFPSESLAQKLENRSHHFGNTYERLFNIYDQVLDAVEYLATLSKPISHGDIKPHNILVGQGDRVKLTDFGSSALPEDFYVRTRENGGTVLYAAPEYSDCATRKGTFAQLLAGDIYSLGVLLYHLLTGRLPYDTQAQVRTHAPFPKPMEINSGVCEAMEDSGRIEGNTRWV